MDYVQIDSIPTHFHTSVASGEVRKSYKDQLTVLVDKNCYLVSSQFISSICYQADKLRP